MYSFFSEFLEEVFLMSEKETNRNSRRNFIKAGAVAGGAVAVIKLLQRGKTSTTSSIPVYLISRQ